MNTEYKMYTLDGMNDGFALIEPDDCEEVFPSLEMAEIYCMRNKISAPVYAIKIGDGYIPYDYIEKVNSIDGQVYYEFYDADCERNIIFIQESSEVSNIGYIVFGKGDSEFIQDARAGKKTSKEIYKEIFLTIARLARYKNIEVIREEQALTIKIVGTTAKVIICTVPHMIWLNQSRQATGGDKRFSRVLPFEKRMDKWTTFYSYITIDKTEPDSWNGVEQAVSIRDQLIEKFKYLQGDELNPRFVPVKFNGTIMV